jgi:hypothetical protein
MTIQIPEHLALTVEEIPYLQHSQLARLTQIKANYFSAWMWQRQISERLLGAVAARMGLSESELLRALELKRQEARRARRARAKAERLIQYLNEQEGTSA